MCAAPEAMTAPLMAFDRALKERGLNPGTSADLTVATLFAAALEAVENPNKCLKFCQRLDANNRLADVVSPGLMFSPRSSNQELRTEAL